ncbi:hypothetical protein COT72_04275 [archaeon CG10_big_fil_rev_8_21_14_0_10_43_11]|nr:MAG: hypothetical protein COT72_04275 [archaeon CG10_big_fil_rev_8_21_14_0_10_43_11]
MKLEWDFSPLFSGDSDPKIEQNRKKWQSATDTFIKKWKNRTDYLTKPSVLKEALDDYEAWSRRYGVEADELYYFWLRSTQDQLDTTIKAKFRAADAHSKNLINDTRFFEHALAKIDKKTQELFLKSAELKAYRHVLERIFQTAKYLLSEEEERILTLKSASAYESWVRMVSSFLSKEEREILNEKGKKETKTFSDILSLLNSQNKKVRDDAARAFNDILAKHAELAEAEINAILEDKKVNDTLRGYTRADQSRHVADDMESEVVDAMLKAVKKAFSLSKDYYALKAALFGKKQLAYHERNVPFELEEKNYSFKEAAQLVTDVFSDLDKEFADYLTSFIENGQIDVFPKKGKTSGAFCAHGLITQPTYVLLNFTKKLSDVTTLAHEMGHAINNELMKKKQHALYFGTSLGTAECASTFMEDFVFERLLKDADDPTRLALLMEKLNSDVSSIMRQVACYQFELELHKTYREKNYLSVQEIGALFQKHMSAYMGPAVSNDEGSENWWVYWGHIRRYFYNYSYASGLLISKALQKRVREQPEYIEQVKQFLSTGLFASPKETFAKIGIDISTPEFWSEGISEIQRLFDQTKELAKKLGKTLRS